MATTDSVTLTDGTTFSVGCRVRHPNKTFSGTVTRITMPDHGAGAIRLCVDPDPGEDFDRAREAGNCWPTQGGKEYVQVRDTGLTLCHWELKQ